MVTMMNLRKEEEEEEEDRSTMSKMALIGTI
jgi:hypothetical protein